MASLLYRVHLESVGTTSLPISPFQPLKTKILDWTWFNIKLLGVPLAEEGPFPLQEEQLELQTAK